jgi:predicted amidophosphoribosyltransferase
VAEIYHSGERLRGFSLPLLANFKASLLFMEPAPVLLTITCPNCKYAMPSATEIPAGAVCSRCGKPLTRRKSHVEDPEID